MTFHYPVPPSPLSFYGYGSSRINSLHTELHLGVSFPETQPGKVDASSGPRKQPVDLCVAAGALTSQLAVGTRP